MRIVPPYKGKRREPNSNCEHDCLAYLIRDVTFLLTLPGREVQPDGRRLQNALRDLFGVIQERGTITAAGF